MDFFESELDNKQIDSLKMSDTVAISYAASGAMGVPGQVIVYYRKNGKAYAAKGNYVYGNLDIKKLGKSLRCFDDNSSKWEEFYLGCGNSLFVNKKHYPDTVNRFSCMEDTEFEVKYRKILLKALIPQAGSKDDIRQQNRKIAAETMEIIDKGGYMYNGKRYDFDFSYDWLREVEVFDPERLERFTDNDDGFMDDPKNETDECSFCVVNMDSFEANYRLAVSDRALVLNFANAHHPGGGFLNGASAQEESLCRCSTLYASISSDKASELYDYNNENPDPYDSEYMLISPYVTVFRHPDGSLRETMFNTAVVTMPAPNLRNFEENIDKTRLFRKMVYKIECILCAAMREDYDTLILGAWGCGAFGHDAADVSEYFKDVLVRMEYYKFFKKIIFAVYDKTPEEYNYKTFLKKFGLSGVWRKNNKEKTRQEMMEEIAVLCRNIDRPLPEGYPENMTDEQMRYFI